MQLALSTWQEVEEYLRGSVGIIVPIGSVEQHGPNGLIGTDHLDAEFVAKGVGDAIGCAVAPTLAYGMSQHHLAFTGSATLRPSTLMLVVRDVVLSLAVHGFRKFFFINGHGGNVASVTAAFDEIYAGVSLGASTAPVQCRMAFWSGPRCRERGGAGAVLSAAAHQARADVAEGGATFAAVLRRCRLSRALSGRPHRLRPVAVDARARQAAVQRRGAGHDRGVQDVSGVLTADQISTQVSNSKSK